MRLPTAVGRFTSSFRTYRERRRNGERRHRKNPFSFERRRRPRREQDVAAKYAEYLSSIDESEK
jgi:hypothetical protein